MNPTTKYILAGIVAGVLGGTVAALPPTPYVMTEEENNSAVFVAMHKECVLRQYTIAHATFADVSMDLYKAIQADCAQVVVKLTNTTIINGVATIGRIK